MWICPNDDTQVQDGQLCPICGEMQPKPVDTTTELVEGWDCACGKRNIAAAKFCSGCGKARPQPKIWICPNDDTKVEEGQRCPICGSSKPEVAAEWRCSSCGTQNRDIAKFCRKCGRPKGAVESVARKKQKHEEKTDIISPIVNAQNRVKLTRALGLLCVGIVLVLFSMEYAKTNNSMNGSWTIYKCMMGMHGDIEQICSIMLLLAGLLPTPFFLVHLSISQRKLPITVSVIAAVAISVYCCVIWFGSTHPTIVPALIILCQFGLVFISIAYVKALEMVDNALFPTADL